jgi:membrane protease YdiL (CAAX protease family)
VLLLLFLPGMIAQATLPPAGLAWSELFAFLLPALVATTGSNLRAGPYLRLGRPPGTALVLGALVGGAGYVLAGATMALAQRLLPEEWVRLFDPAKLFEGPLWERVLLAAVAVLVAPPCEEIAFRGYVQTTLALRRRPAVAIGGAAVLFAAMHLDPVRFPALILLGAVFGWLTWRSGSVWPAVAAHAANNGIASTLVLTLGVPDADARPAPVWFLLATAAVGASALALLLRAFRAATPPPAPAADGVALRDPAVPSIAFSATRVPRALRAGALAGLALLLAIVLAGALGVAHRRRPPGAAPAAPAPAAPATAVEPRDPTEVAPRPARDHSGGGP